jgi:hypothetical protein
VIPRHWHLALSPLDFPVLVVPQLDISVSLLAMSSDSQSLSELQIQYVDYASGMVVHTSS